MIAFQTARRERDAQRSFGEWLRDSWRRTTRRQTQFSLVSAALAAVLALTLIVDYMVGHSHIQRFMVGVWIGSYLMLTLIPLVLGRRYPLWAGLLFVGYLTYWSVHNLLNTNHPHMELNALLEAPMVAVYLGWFYPPWIARTGLWLHLAALTSTVLLRTDVENHQFSTDLALLYAILIAVFCLEAASYTRRDAERAARYDPLTGVLNRRGLAHLGDQALARARQSGGPLVLAVVDFDDFKTVNDTGGHAEGDLALKTCSAEWEAGLGSADLVARTGGDEFVLLIHSDEAEADARLAELRRRTAYSWTWGLARFGPDDTLDSLMLRADQALYGCKEARGG